MNRAIEPHSNHTTIAPRIFRQARATICLASRAMMSPCERITRSKSQARIRSMHSRLVAPPEPVLRVCGSGARGSSRRALEDIHAKAKPGLDESANSTDVVLDSEESGGAEHRDDHIADTTVTLAEVEPVSF